MFASLEIGRIAGTRVKVHFTFLLFLLWIGVSDYLARGAQAAAQSVSFIVLLFTCVMLHEFGHILVARRFGVRTPEAELYPIGGVAKMERIPEKPAQEFAIAIAGPLVNVVIAALLIVLGGLPDQAGVPAADAAASQPLLQRLATANIVLVIFNLIPAFPMDGGRVLRALLASRMGYAKATRIAARLGQALAAVFVAAGLFYNPVLMFVGIFVYLAAAGESESVSLRHLTRGLSVSDAMETTGLVLAPEASLAEAVDALLSSPQKELPVIDAAGRGLGLISREGLIRALHGGTAGLRAADIIEPAEAVTEGLALDAALDRMNGTRARAMLVAAADGRFAGLLTADNISEMMLIHHANPDFRFRRRGREGLTG